MRGLSPEEGLNFALGAGSLAVASELTINPAMSEAAVRELLRENGILFKD